MKESIVSALYLGFLIAHAAISAETFEIDPIALRAWV
jgi:hypothetical protein